MDKIKVTITFAEFNGKRYGNPWIAYVKNWPVGSKLLDLEFGSYIGDCNGGEAEVMAEIGSIIRYGQKDNRGNRTISKWGFVRTDGLTEQCTMLEARKIYDNFVKIKEVTK